MEINLAPLLLKQRELDADINSRHNVTHESTKTERFLALLVEIGELANATRAFKYWSLKKVKVAMYYLMNSRTVYIFPLNCDCL